MKQPYETTWDQNNQASIKAWEDISSEYATCASGTVTGIIGKDLRPGNIWEKGNYYG